MKPKRKAFDRCILHVGCEKTGSTTLQRFLSVNRRPFRKEGITYPVADGVLYGSSQLQFAVVSCNEVWKTELGARQGLHSPEDFAAYRTSFQSNLEMEFSKLRKQHTLVISSEHFHSRLKTPEEINNLKDFLEPYAQDFQVVIYFRRQDRVATSLFATHIKSRMPSPKPFLPDMDSPDALYYDYSRIFSQWAQVFGLEAMVPRIYHPEEFFGSGLIEDFCHSTGLNFDGKTIPHAHNPSLDPSATAFLIHVNKCLQEENDRDILCIRGRLVRELEKVRPGRVLPFHRKRAKRFFEQFRESNETLRRIAFPGREQPIFDEDFSEYPEIREKLPFSHASGVTVGMEVAFSLISQIQQLEKELYEK